MKVYSYLIIAIYRNTKLCPVWSFARTTQPVGGRGQGLGGARFAHRDLTYCSYEVGLMCRWRGLGPLVASV
jgi:hypothetical protein